MQRARVLNSTGLSPRVDMVVLLVSGVRIRSHVPVVTARWTVVLRPYHRYMVGCVLVMAQPAQACAAYRALGAVAPALVIHEPAGAVSHWLSSPWLPQDAA